MDINPKVGDIVVISKRWSNDGINHYAEIIGLDSLNICHVRLYEPIKDIGLNTFRYSVFVEHIIRIVSSK